MRDSFCSDFAILNEIWYNMDQNRMNICMQINPQLEAAECLQMKNPLSAFAVVKVRVFEFRQNKVSEKKQKRSSNKTYT